jgi:hypothetical protein
MLRERTPCEARKLGEVALQVRSPYRTWDFDGIQSSLAGSRLCGTNGERSSWTLTRTFRANGERRGVF